MVAFNGFRQIVDTLGGIDAPLVCAFTDWHIIDPLKSDQNEDNWALYTIGPGVVHMDGDLALWYARSRMRSSDFDRGRRQQEVLRAIFTQSIRLDVIPKLYDFANQDPTRTAELLYRLNIPHANLIVSPNPESATAYRLILGTDYNPWFDPALLIH